MGKPKPRCRANGCRCRKANIRIVCGIAVRLCDEHRHIDTLADIKPASEPTTVRNDGKRGG